MTLTEAQKRLFEAAKACAIEIRSGKVGGLTGTVGELSTCDCPRANWISEDGFDAIIVLHQTYYLFV